MDHELLFNTHTVLKRSHFHRRRAQGKLFHSTKLMKCLKHGLSVDSKDHHGLNAIQVATTENPVDMVKFLLVNGSEVNETVKNKIPSTNLDEMLQKREVGHRIVIPDPMEGDVFRRNENEQPCNENSVMLIVFERISIYRGYPENR